MGCAGPNLDGKMKIQTAIKHFGTAAELARNLGLTRQAIYMWQRNGEYVPKHYALEIDYLTNGKVKFNPRIYKNTSGRGGTSRCPSTARAN